MREQLGPPRRWLWTGHVVGQWRSVLLQLGGIVLPILGQLVVVGRAAQLGQIGFLFLPEKLAGDVCRIGPLRGLQRIFSVANVVRLAFGLFKILWSSGWPADDLWRERDSIPGMSGRAGPTDRCVAG